MTGGESETTPATDPVDEGPAAEAEPAEAAAALTAAGELVYENRALRVFELPDGRHRLVHTESGRHVGEWSADDDGAGFWSARQQADVSAGKATTGVRARRTRR